MLTAFLKTKLLPVRIAIAAEPSAAALSLFHDLRRSNIVFSIPNTSCSHLVHLLAEARVEALVTDDLESKNLVQKFLGIPTFPAEHVPEEFLHETSDIILEGRTADSSMPRATLIDKTAWESQIGSNQIFNENRLTWLSLSRNWLLDSDSWPTIFPSSDAVVAPEVIAVDNESLPRLSHLLKSGSVLSNNLSKIVFDVPFIDESPQIVQLHALLDMEGVEIVSRYSVPELGPFAFGKNVSDLTVLPGFQLQQGSDTLAVKTTRGKWSYLYRDNKSVSDAFVTSIKVKADIEEKGSLLRRKRRIMQPDWRVRKVPIATYHKKRGAKGQIYVTTKHKGWTFYKSRY